MLYLMFRELNNLWYFVFVFQVDFGLLQTYLAHLVVISLAYLYIYGHIGIYCLKSCICLNVTQKNHCRVSMTLLHQCLLSHTGSSYVLVCCKSCTFNAASLFSLWGKHTGSSSSPEVVMTSSSKNYSYQDFLALSEQHRGVAQGSTTNFHLETLPFFLPLPAALRLLTQLYWFCYQFTGLSDQKAPSLP